MSQKMKKKMQIEFRKIWMRNTSKLERMQTKNHQTGAELQPFPIVFNYCYQTLMI